MYTQAPEPFSWLTDPRLTKWARLVMCYLVSKRSEPDWVALISDVAANSDVKDRDVVSRELTLLDSLGYTVKALPDTESRAIRSNVAIQRHVFEDPEIGLQFAEGIQGLDDFIEQILSTGGQR